MHLKFVEAVSSGNWGKFAIGAFTAQEWLETEQAPVAWMEELPEGAPMPQPGRLIAGRGWTLEHIWVFDLQTGEGAMFLPGGHAHNDLEKHKIWVCPLFEPFLEWLYESRRKQPQGWWDSLPRVVELPDAPFEVYGHRRPGPDGARRPGFSDLLAEAMDFREVEQAEEPGPVRRVRLRKRPADFTGEGSDPV